MPNRLVLRNGSVIDGSGTPAISTDLLIEDGKICGRIGLRRLGGRPGIHRRT